VVQPETVASTVLHIVRDTSLDDGSVSARAS
jgi:hypothetical protein